MLAGFVAGEGSFWISSTKRLHLNGEPIKRFVFTITVQTRDLAMLETLRDFLGVGSIHHSPPRRSHWQPQCAFVINSIKSHRLATIPFADAYLLPCAKRTQFELWRQSLTEYVDRFNVRIGFGRSTCSVEGCEGLVRGRGLCRRHYYRVTGY